MDDEREINLKKYHSSYVVTRAPKESSHSESTCKSELNVTSLSNALSEASRNCDNVQHPREYYKRYEHDEIPVKDSNGNGFRKKPSLTNSVLDELEMKIFKNVSQQLQTEDSTVSGLESNIKFFKTTVQEIFDNFYASMRDFELYKKRFQEILNKNRDDSVADMEEFIKDMIQHILSSETISRKTTDLSMQACTDKDVNVSEISEDYTGSNTSGVLEAFKNENYHTDFTLDDNSSSSRRYSSNADTYNIFLLRSTPCLQAKINDRNLLSEINIKDLNSYDNSGGHVVSADNMKKFAAKRMEMEKHIMQRQGDTADVEIPVKVSYAKKNIYLNEDFTPESPDNRQSLISKICNFLCKKFRKNSFG